jgi:hypothetical protein
MVRPLEVLARPVGVGRDRRQLLAFHDAQNHADLLRHASIPPNHGLISLILTRL